jgi:hypothetical protein
MHALGEADTVSQHRSFLQIDIAFILAIVMAACAGENTMNKAGKQADINWEDIPKEGRDALCAMLEFAVVALALAAPRVMAKAPHVPSQAELLRILDSYLSLIADAKRRPNNEDNKPHIAAEPHVVRLRELVAAWQPSKDVPDTIKAAARSALLASDATEPPEGWDYYEGEPQSD